MTMVDNSFWMNEMFAHPVQSIRALSLRFSRWTVFGKIIFGLTADGSSSVDVADETSSLSF